MKKNDLRDFKGFTKKIDLISFENGIELVERL